jgi:hypothetical protein
MSSYRLLYWDDATQTIVTRNPAGSYSPWESLQPGETTGPSCRT